MVKDESKLIASSLLIQDFSEEKPLGWSHFTAEGDVEFRAVLFVPPKAPHDLYESYYNTQKSNLKLYVRRVFISDEFDDLLPKYLSFLRVNGVNFHVDLERHTAECDQPDSAGT